MVKNANSISLKLRAGVHTGEVERRGDDIDGLAVNIARRVCDIARPDEVLVTRTVTDLLVASGFEFEDREEHELKGVPGSWQLFAVRG
jgi:class 3 adenylate cyclase